MWRLAGYNAAPRVLGWCLALSLLAVSAGCHTPAVPYTVEAGAEASPRGLVLARQLAADTALAVGRHPVQCSWENLCEIRDHLLAIADDLLGKRLAMHLWPTVPPLLPDVAPQDAGALESCLHRLTGRDLQPAQVQLYPGGAEALASLYQIIDHATCRLDVLMFYWENDALSQEVAARLAARAGPHLPVRVLVDGGGNLVFNKTEHAPHGCLNHVVSWLARQPHVEVLRIRNPFARFDHRKLVLADGRAAWTGGRNFAASAFFKHHDLSFTLTGPLVAELQERFDAFWKEQGGQIRNQESGIEKQMVSADSPAPSAESNAFARLLHAGPGDPQLATALYEAIDRAGHYVYVENVYFSDSRLVYKLARARRRGVDVRAVLTFSTSSDHINRANRVITNRLLGAGVRVYVYPVMTHVKAAAVDGCWAYLGTGNFDPLSMRHNRELGLSVSGGALIGEVEERLFLTDFRPEWEVTEPLPLSVTDYACELLASLAL